MTEFNQFTLAANRLNNVRKGDVVDRMLCGMLPMQVRVSEVTPLYIVCGAYKFDRTTGAELDEELGWTTEESGSFIQPHFEDVAQQ